MPGKEQRSITSGDGPAGPKLGSAVVAVTGASAGIGAETVRCLVRNGARVVAGARRGERLAQLVEELGPEKVAPEVMNVAKPEDSRRLVRTAIERFGRLDAIVLNAGLGMYGGILDHSDEECAEMIEVNFAGTVWGVRAAVPALLAGGGGDVVIVSSVAGLRGGGNEAVYAGTKAAQLALAGCLDREVRERNIRVSTLCPAAVSTEFAIGRGRSEGDPWLDQVLQAADVAEAVLVCLTQPRHVRTTQWAMWSMAEPS